ncbi:hypothetical protein LX64_02643 [Chitinophaga skermanii]|uniref:Uncharacterized protein n=1 Tax=Chitinophaga skermanii TaxID=331697 RepID=A0A327QNL6_9BACT|nr:hypothetical protein [Chitinophaga skermanii]RAJ05485.1 hypothetical protein LX64_02643 [Chitinophaga skermanii]
MGFLNKLFGKPGAPAIAVEKDKVPVYPMIKDARWPGLAHAAFIPFVQTGDTLELAIVFPQDAGDKFEYITQQDLQNEAIKVNFSQWQQNIDAYPFAIDWPEPLRRRIFVTPEEDHAAEKILSPAFLAEACKLLKTDKLLISAPRRRFLMMTSYYEEFKNLELFFYYHFNDFKDDTSGCEIITDMIFVADAQQVQYAAPLSFRMNLYEKDGQMTLSYSSMEDLFDENGYINFQAIIEAKKIPVMWPR